MRTYITVNLKLVICSKINPFFSQKAYSRIFLAIWYWITLYLSVFEIWVFLNQVFFQLEKQSSYDEFDFFFFLVCCTLKSSSLKQTTLSEFQTRHFKQGKISCSTRECRKSSANRYGVSIIWKTSLWYRKKFLDLWIFCSDNLSLDFSVHFQPSVVCRRLIEHKFQPRRNLTYNEPWWGRHF